MSLRIRLLLTIIFIILIFSADIVANKLYLYWTYDGLDKGMHLCGGIASGFLTLLAVELSKKKHFRLVAALIGALLIGIVWEITEYSLHISHLGPGFVSDTLSDLGMDIIGGLISYFIWIKIPQKTQI